MSVSCLPTPTATSNPGPQQRLQGGCWAGCSVPARQRRAAGYQMLLPASASESSSPWQPALPDAPWAQHRHCSPASVIAASLAGGTDIFSRFRASLETGSLTSELRPAEGPQSPGTGGLFQGLGDHRSQDSTGALVGLWPELSPGLSWGTHTRGETEGGREVVMNQPHTLADDILGTPKGHTSLHSSHSDPRTFPWAFGNHRSTDECYEPEVPSLL